MGFDNDSEINKIPYNTRNNGRISEEHINLLYEFCKTIKIM